MFNFIVFGIFVATKNHFALPEKNIILGKQQEKNTKGFLSFKKVNENSAFDTINIKKRGHQNSIIRTSLKHVVPGRILQCQKTVIISTF